MASAMAKVMLSAVLGLCALFLQGCGKDVEVSEDNSAAYATAAAGAGEGKAAKDLQTKEGCAPLLAGVSAYKDDLVKEVVKGVTDSQACIHRKKATFKARFTSAECKTIIVQKLADTSLFLVEKDPGFTNWTKTEDAKNSWTKEAKGEVETELLKAFEGPAAALQSFVGVKIAEGATKGTDVFTAYLTSQVWQATEATLGVFCPAPVAAVAAAEAADAGSVAAQKTQEAAEKAEQVEDAKDQAAADGIDATGESTTTIAASTTSATGRRLKDLMV